MDRPRRGLRPLAAGEGLKPVAVDAQCERTIPCPRSEVAAYAADPDNTTTWYSNIKAVEWETPRPLAVGSRLAFIATFLGRRLSYTYEIRELVAGERGAVAGVLRNRGEPSGFKKIAAPIMARAMQRAMTKDLERLSAILQRRA
jgi:hypothetical protein